MALLVAIFSFFLTFKGAGIQVETLLYTILAGKAQEANGFGNLANSTPGDPLPWQHTLAAIIQGIQILRDIRTKHRVLLCCASETKYASVFYLHLRTDIQNKIFGDPGFRDFLLEGKSDSDQADLKSHLKGIETFFQQAYNRYRKAPS